jgi:hypothetical protein
MFLQWSCTLWKERLNSHGQQFHQYQQNKQSPLILSHWTWKKPQNNTEYDVGNPGPGLGQEQICDGFRPDNWIIRYEYNSIT